MSGRLSAVIAVWFSPLVTRQRALLKPISDLGHAPIFTLFGQLPVYKLITTFIHKYSV